MAPNSEDSQAQATGTTSGAVMVVNHNHHLFLHSSDVSGIQIISFQLTGVENYSVWFRSMRIALLGRNKLGMVDRSCKKEMSLGLECNWERVNAIVLSWIMNSVSKNLLGGIMYASNAKVVWDDLFERFNKVDGSRTFNLHKEIATLSQDTSSVSMYYSKLKGLWEEFEALVPIPGCSCEGSKEYSVHHQNLKLFQFLMGLNDSYLQARSQIIMLKPVPSVNQAYSMILSDESQRSVVANAGVLGHTRENCYKIIVYPQDFMFKKKGVSSSAYNVTGDSEDGLRSRSNDGVRSNASDTGSGQLRCDGEVKIPHQNQLESCTLTREQYNQVLQFLDKKSEVSHCVNPVGTNSTPRSQSHSPGWIIDTGATNHVVADLSLLKNQSISKVENPKKVHLPNGDKALVTHLGSSTLDGKNTVSGELFSGKVKMIGREDGGLYILSNKVKKDDVVLSARHSEHSDRKTKKLDIQLLHKRLGHSSSSKLKKLLNTSLEDITKMPSSVIADMFPFEKLYNKKPFLHQLRVLGCLYFAKRVNESDKLKPRDVVFQEDVFPFKLKSKDSVPVFTYTGINHEVDDLKEVSIATHSQHNSQTKILPQEQVENTEVETSTNLQQTNVYKDIQAEHISQTEVRKSGRRTKPPLWLKDFVSLNINKGPYSLDKYVSYSSINPTYQTYLAKMSSVIEPQSYKEAVSDPRWTEAMNAEIKALQDNHTWEVVELPDGKTPIGCR
ncbi:uncharacterized protein [Solanum tuberosum]|uniref:uncharacterized protein n=1 Tax=Solanum tuberosum TaxID=4113 RepID=UPI00073A248B|nr:PREDICTED: uncharacterized protein LOC107059281 [Solanum tuberosum]